MDVPRISAHALRRRMASGSKPLMVCGYDSDERFREMGLEGAISWASFQSRLSSLPSDQEIVFY